MKKFEVMFFPGKNTPLKRYVSYFPKLSLTASQNDIILCHSRGLDHAVQYCLQHKIEPLIVSMDGVQIDIPEHLNVISFRPEHKQPLGDEYMYTKTIYYDVKETHHPYMNKKVRDQIMREIINHKKDHRSCLKTS